MKVQFDRSLYNDEDVGLMFLLTLIIPVVVGFISSMILGAIGSSFGVAKLADSPALYSIYMVLVNGSLVGIFFVYNHANKVNYIKASLIKPKFGWLNVLLCCLIAPIMLFGSMYLINYLMSLLQNIGYNPNSSLPLPLSNFGWLVLNILILAVLPAVCEELVYRGIIFNGLRKFGSTWAVIISAVIFALAHGSAMQFFYQLILGVVLALIVLKTGSIVASALVHFLNNAMVVVYSYISLRIGETTVEFTPWVIVASFGAFVVGALLIWLIFKFMKEKKVEEKTQNQVYFETYALSERKFSSSRSVFMFTLSIVLGVAIWCVGTFIN